MPTTRSQGRHEPLQRLETPTKRQRKPNPSKPLLSTQNTQESQTRKKTFFFPAKDFKNGHSTQAISIVHVTYAHKSTQTEEVVVLTKTEIADLKDRAATAAVTTSLSHKRSRDDESEDDPLPKRHQFSTPQNNKVNNLWMFGEKADGDHPRTAPSKSFANSSSIRRPSRGPIARRNNHVGSPRFRVRPSIMPGRDADLRQIKPIERDAEHREDGQQEHKQPPRAGTSETQLQQQRQQQESAIPQTPQRGLFGSLRGIVNKGWGFATSLTPLASRTESAPASQNSAVTNQIAYPQIEADTNSQDASGDRPSQADQDAQRDYASPERTESGRFQRTSQYDHLHYIPANTGSVGKAIAGELEPPARARTPPSPGSRLKAQNPQLSDAAIGSILKKRERRAALDEERYGPQSTPEITKVAPLFGPNSHYARGTVDPRFLPSSSLYGSGKKRKLEFADDEATTPRNQGFRLDDEDTPDFDWEADDVQQPHDPAEAEADMRPAKRQRAHEGLTAAPMPATPRSALKKPGMPGSIGRKSVAFGESISRDIRGHYGPAGQYKGSTFADDLSDDHSLSSIDQADVISPNTRLNTFANSGRKSPSVRDNFGASVPVIDFTLRDPQDLDWRPSLGNPCPGVFRVPDVDEEDPDESMSDITPEQPQTPRMSHAELPGTSQSNALAALSEGVAVNDSTEVALDKARSKAEKYKPKSSSRLSEVSRARSRSTSPDAEDEDHVSAEQFTQPSATTAPAVRPIGAPPQPFVPRELDNTVKGTDGMTDHEREHQYDDWAASLQWDTPQTYEDAGTGSTFIHDLIRKNWSDEDSQRSEAFWAREFDEVDRAMEAAKAKGHRLTLVTGMEGIEGY